jgi:undecaprenyl-diphosphatase
MLLWMMIQILIESLPISSSGHVVLLQHWYTKLGYYWPHDQVEQINFLLHGPSLIIMLFYFFTIWSYMILGKKLEFQDFFKITNYKKVFQPFVFILIVDLITFLFWKIKILQTPYMEQYFLSFGFILTAVMLFLSKFMHGNKEVHFVWWHAIVLGIAQSLAFLPGVSRFATTFFAARCLQYSPYNAFAVSFLIQFPLVCAAFVSCSFQIYHNADIWYQIFNFCTLFVMVCLSFLSYIIFCYVGKMIQQNKIWYFSLYMILPIIISILI